MNRASFSDNEFTNKNHIFHEPSPQKIKAKQIITMKLINVFHKILQQSIYHG